MIKQAYETDRLVLHLSNREMAQQVTEYFIRNKEFLKTTEPLRDDEFYTFEFQRNELESDEKNCENLSGVKFWITQKGSDKVIGMVALNGIMMGAFQSCFLAYRLDEDELNKGFMTEAVRKGIEIAFNEVGLHRIEANIMPRNRASLRVAEKLNFNNEGLASKYLKINGIWEDHIHMVLLNENA